MPSSNNLKKKKGSKTHKQIIPESKTGEVRRPGIESQPQPLSTEDVIEVRYGEASSIKSYGHSVDPAEEDFLQKKASAQKSHDLSSQDSAVTHAIDQSDVGASHVESDNKINRANDASSDFGKSGNIASDEKMSFKFNFIGSDLVRKVFPKSLDVIEKVTEDWKQDGEFDEIPIDQPFVQFLVGESCRRAKKIEKSVEKKIEEKLPEVLIKAQAGIEKVQSGIEVAKKIIKKKS